MTEVGRVTLLTRSRDEGPADRGGLSAGAAGGCDGETSPLGRLVPPRPLRARRWVGVGEPLYGGGVSARVEWRLAALDGPRPRSGSPGRPGPTADQTRLNPSRRGAGGAGAWETEGRPRRRRTTLRPVAWRWLRGETSGRSVSPGRGAGVAGGVRTSLRASPPLSGPPTRPGRGPAEGEEGRGKRGEGGKGSGEWRGVGAGIGVGGPCRQRG